MDIRPPDFKYCPFCTETLVVRIEEDRERKYCPNCEWRYFPSPAVAVTGVIIKNNKVLMVQRNREPFLGTWMFPAGFVEYGEDLPEALVREVKEETGLKVSKATLICIQQSRDDPREPGHFVVFYRVNASGKIRNKDLDENRAVGWFPIMNPPPIGFPVHQLMMNRLQSERRKK